MPCKPITIIAAPVSGSVSVAAVEMPSEPGFPAGIRAPDKARGEAAIVALGERLPEVAAFYGKSPQELRKLFRTDNSLRVIPERRFCQVSDPR
jgi:hypothetical protein